jgi:iron complex outermembrane receptor protein
MPAFFDEMAVKSHAGSGGDAMKGMKWAVIYTVFVLAGTSMNSIAALAADSTEPALTSDTKNVPVTEVEVKAEKEKKPKEGSVEVGYKPETAATTGPWGDKKIQDLPYSVNVMSSDLIENVQANSDQLFRMNPLTQYTINSSGYNNINPTAMIRGFYTASPLIDGVRTSSNYGVNLEELDRVEIYSGAPGFLYGGGNPGGWTNYVLKRPTAERYDSLTVGSTSGSDYFAHGDFGGPIDKAGKFGYRINLLGENGDTAVKDQNLMRYLASGAFDWHVTNNLLVQVEAAHSRYRMDGRNASFGFATGVKHPDAPDPDKLFAPSYTFNDVESDRVGANIKWDINDIFTVRAAYTYQQDNRNSLIPWSTLQTNGTYSESLYLQAFPQKCENQGGYLFLDTKFKTASIEHKVTAGFSGNFYNLSQHQDYTATSTTNGLSLDGLANVPYPAFPTLGTKPMFTSYATGNKNWTIGDDIKINEQWSALLGATYAEIQQFSWSTTAQTANYNQGALTPTVSLIFKPVPWISTYVTYMEALEQGTIVGTGYSNTGEALKPLLDRQYEVGVKATVGGSLLTGALFRIDKANQYSNNATPIPTWIQDGHEVHQGFEFTDSGKVTNDLTLMGGFTIFDATVEKTNTPSLQGKTPVGVAQQLAKIYGEYQLPWVKGLIFTGGVYYTGKWYADTLNTDRIPANVIGDVGARYETKVYDLPTIFRLNVTNVADTSYWTYTYCTGAPRSIAFSAQVKF